MIEIKEKKYREIRCPNCRKLLGYEYVVAGRLAFICPRCSQTTDFEMKYINSLFVRRNLQKEFGIDTNEQPDAKEVSK